MSLRKKPHARCPRCLMRKELCMCEYFSAIDLSTRVVVISRPREIISPSNTARIVSQVLPNSSVYLHGSKDTTFDLADHLDDRKSTFFLYPDSEGIFIDDIDWRKFENGVNLIVPDGNWRQTSKMKKRIKGLENFPTIQFRSLPESMYRIRAERKSNGLATLEAIALALGYIEGPHVQTSLLDLLHIQTTRILQSRGQRPTDLT